MARNAILGAYTGHIHPPPDYAVYFAVVTALLNINMNSCRQCRCGFTETLGHLLLQRSLSSHHRKLLLPTLKIPCSTKKFVISRNAPPSLKKVVCILLFDHPELSFKPAGVIFTALSRFRKHAWHFKFLV